ncbi:MAG: class I SAM-dependent methyltransferase [Patescibacteria group bacterium]|nr:class I SAM-dependent methyltransferase [Patescibacteria group bacterium]
METPHDAPGNQPFSAEDLRSIYETRFGDRSAYRDRVWRVLVRDYFQRFVRPQDAILDLGAGHGEFINHISCGKKYAMDLNPDTAKRVNADVEVMRQDCAKPWLLPDGSLDVVFTSNFFEHLPDKQALARALAEARRCLKRGGRLIAMGPNIKYVPGSYWDFWDHHLPLTEQSLAEALSLHGFRVEHRIGKFLPFTMARGPRYPVCFVAAYLRFPPAWRIFGKQFLVIGKKRA